MNKIDDIKLQMYVDGELDSSEAKDIEKYISENSEAKKIVDNYKKINHLIYSTYNQIKSEDLPRKTLNLLMEEKNNFFKRIIDYRVPLLPTLGSIAAVLIVIVITFNSNQILKKTNDPIYLMSENNKNIVLEQLEGILKNSKEIINGFVSLKDQNIQYEETNSYIDKFGRNSKDITFKNFLIKDFIINSATFIETDNGDWKVIKLEFEKNNSLGI